MSNVTSTQTYKGFMIQKVTIESAGSGTGTTPSKHSYTQYQIRVIDGKPDQFVSALNFEDAKRKIDSGDAEKQLKKQLKK